MHLVLPSSAVLSFLSISFVVSSLSRDDLALGPHVSKKKGLNWFPFALDFIAKMTVILW